MIPGFRILLILSFSLFWGGLTFYTGFVVRISHDVLEDPMDGGLITQRVTNLLQYLGGVAVILMFLNSWQVRKQALLNQDSLLKRYSISLTTINLILAASVCGLIVVHHQLDSVIDISNYEITDREQFVKSHRRYNQLTTVEWLSSIASISISLLAWRRMDLRKSKIELA